MFYTIEETVEALKSGKTTSEDLVRSSIDTFEKDKKSEKPLNAILMFLKRQNLQMKKLLLQKKAAQSKNCLSKSLF